MLRAQGRSVRGDNQAARRLRVDAWAALGDANLDPTTVKANLAQANAMNSASRAKVEAAIIDFAAPLPAPERAAFGQAIRRAILKQGPAAPWKAYQNYIRDLLLLRRGQVDDGLRFSRVPALRAVAEPAEQPVADRATA